MRPYNFRYITIAPWANKPTFVAIPVIFALVAIYHLSGSGGIQASPLFLRLVRHGVSDALIRSQGRESETQSQAGPSESLKGHFWLVAC